MIRLADSRRSDTTDPVIRSSLLLEAAFGEQYAVRIDSRAILGPLALDEPDVLIIATPPAARTLRRVRLASMLERLVWVRP